MFFYRLDRNEYNILKIYLKFFFFQDSIKISVINLLNLKIYFIYQLSYCRYLNLYFYRKISYYVTIRRIILIFYCKLVVRIYHILK